MFTGIIESTGTIHEITQHGSNKSFWIASTLTDQLKVDQSVSHDGVCLTVEEIRDQYHKVTAVRETLEKTHLGLWKTGTTINLERSLLLISRLDGHFVQGHVDTTGICERITDQKGSWNLQFTFPKKFAELIIEKGSICINGVSLTAFNVKKKSFNVAIIPYTWEHTNFRSLEFADKVNLEFDMIGKYILRRLSLEK